MLCHNEILALLIYQVEHRLSIFVFICLYICLLLLIVTNIPYFIYWNCWCLYFILFLKRYFYIWCSLKMFIQNEKCCIWSLFETVSRTLYQVYIVWRTNCNLLDRSPGPFSLESDRTDHRDPYLWYKHFITVIIKNGLWQKRLPPTIALCKIKYIEIDIKLCYIE